MEKAGAPSDIPPLIGILPAGGAPWPRPVRTRQAKRGLRGVLLPFAHPVVVFRTVDAPAFPVLFPVQLRPFPGRDDAVRLGPHLVALDFRLPALETPGFAARELAALHALADARLLIVLALRDDGRMGLGKCAPRQQDRHDRRRKNSLHAHTISPHVE